jgi:hypothetical protein
VSRAIKIRIAIVILAFGAILQTAPFAKADDAGTSQLFSLQAGAFRPDSVALSNGSYAFDYGHDSLGSFLAEAGWSARLFRFHGAFSIEENLAFTTFSADSNSISASSVTGNSITVNMLGFDTRLMYSIDVFPWKRLIPFVDAGYQYTLYYQSGASDLESVQGGVGNFAAGGGLRFWLNRDSSLAADHVNRFSSFPFFITAKVNRIFPQSGPINLSSTTLLGGISVGL